jgi:drug/metabolite transporter (DMT)-like permease
MTREHSVALVLLTAFLWSIGGVLIKSVEWHPMAIAGGRSAFAALTVWVLCRPLRFTWSRVQVGAALAYCGTVVLFVVATRLGTAANAIFLQFTAPIYVALLGAWLLGEKPRALDWLLIVATQAGIALFFLDRLDFRGVWGNAAGVTSGLCFGSMVVLLRRQKDASPVESVLLGNVLAALAGVPFMFESAPSTTSFLALVVLGVVQLGLPYVIYSQVLKHVRALDTLLIGMIEPVLNPLWVLLVFGERPQQWALVGGAVVVAAATIRGVLTARERETVRIPPPEGPPASA